MHAARAGESPTPAMRQQHWRGLAWRHRPGRRPARVPSRPDLLRPALTHSLACTLICSPSIQRPEPSP